MNFAKSIVQNFQPCCKKVSSRGISFEKFNIEWVRKLSAFESYEISAHILLFKYFYYSLFHYVSKQINLRKKWNKGKAKKIIPKTTWAKITTCKDGAWPFYRITYGSVSVDIMLVFHVFTLTQTKHPGGKSISCRKIK